VLTHAHTDHAGNCAYLREKYGAPTAVHAGDAGEVERADMFWSHDRKRAFAPAIARTMLCAAGTLRTISWSVLRSQKTHARLTTGGIVPPHVESLPEYLPDYCEAPCAGATLFRPACRYWAE